MSQRFQPTGGVTGPPQSPQQARYQQPMPQPPPGTPMRPYSGPSQNFPVSIHCVFIIKRFQLEKEVIINKYLIFFSCRRKEDLHHHRLK